MGPSESLEMAWAIHEEQYMPAKWVVTPIENNAMSCKSLAIAPTPIQVQRAAIDRYDLEKEQLNHNSTTASTSRSKREFQIVNLSPSILPDGWIVEERPRISNPSHVDREETLQRGIMDFPFVQLTVLALSFSYYYEPGTRRQFRSLLSVQRYLAQEAGDYLITETMMSKNDDTWYQRPVCSPHCMVWMNHSFPSNWVYVGVSVSNWLDMRHNTTLIRSGGSYIQPDYKLFMFAWFSSHPKTQSCCVYKKIMTCIDSGTGQQFHALTAVDKFLSGENACAAMPKSAVKSGTRKQRARGVRSSQKPVHKRSSVAEDKITLKALKQPTLPPKFDSSKKIYLEETNGASMHNLTAPPAKVSWVLSGPGGFWSPFLDDSSVTESEKLKWSEAFVLSVHGGAINGLDS
ncbi:hypothetical protein VNO77_28992 [Canavalia gladiata]|uniref:Uncharacterized protein n=1 Tax=Canavalia gladiata TaxID=3824 RepID=A0AAN9KWM4_CANGL